MNYDFRNFPVFTFISLIQDLRLLLERMSTTELMSLVSVYRDSTVVITWTKFTAQIHSSLTQLRKLENYKYLRTWTFLGPNFGNLHLKLRFLWPSWVLTTSPRPNPKHFFLSFWVTQKSSLLESCCRFLNTVYCFICWQILEVIYVIKNFGSQIWPPKK